MNNMDDYIGWLGKFSFDEMPFNEVDNFIFCEFSYLVMKDWNVVFPIRLQNLLPYLEEHKDELGTFYGNQDVIERIITSKRFGELKLTHYKDVFDDDLSAQFSAMTFEISPQTCFVAYRGTDDSMAGWKEDFMISYKKTEAQNLALSYLKDVTALYENVYVGGHSKGANLALYATAYLSEEEYRKIKWLYMNDGPGFCTEVCNENRIRRIAHRASRFLPEYSIFGKLFEPVDIPEIIVKSENDGVMQHNLHSWCIEYGKPKEVSRHDSGSLWINSVLDEWIESVSNDRRESFVEDLFSAIRDSGIDTTADLEKKGPRVVEAVLINLLSMDKKSVKTAMKLPLTAALDHAPNMKKVRSIKEKLFDHPYWSSLFMIAIGAILLVFRHYAMETLIASVLFLVILYEIIVTLRHLWKSKFDFEKESFRVYLCLILIGIYTVILLKEQALFLIGSMAVGVGFLVAGYRAVVRLSTDITEVKEKKKRKNKFYRFKTFLEIILFFIFGAFVLIAPQYTMEWYMVSVGVALLLDGLANLYLQRSSRKKEPKSFR